jgi:ubiquinol-cytochrome c reductase cytochrome c1 subunit
MLEKSFIAFALLVAWPLVSAAVEEGEMEEMDVYLSNEAALQRGAKYFVNYCSGCHSAQYMRYSRLAEDLNLSAKQVERNLIFTDQKIGDTMTNAMRPQDAARWFGNAPPDLSLIARAQGADWIYNYLKDFYLDPSRPLGVNNLTSPNVAMPHVLGDLQGWQRPVYKRGGAGEAREIEHLKLSQPGLMTPEEYDHMVRDLVTFLVYISEPVQMTRTQVGVWVMLFLVVLLTLSYLLKKEYWKDVH